MMKTFLQRPIIYSVIFFCILTIGTLLRTHRLTEIPPSLSHDEVAIAFNAYSLLTTGKDEYGIAYPILFRSFDDYKLPGMVYSTIIPIAIFGKGEVAARLPSAVFGILSIAVLYAITQELFGASPSNTQKKDLRLISLAALFVAFLLAIQPWHVNFSRQLFESNGAVFWLMCGIWMLLKSRKTFSFIFFSGISFVLSLYFYYSVRLVIPFLLLLYVMYFYRTILKNWKITLISVIVCAALFAPLGAEMISPGGLERISIVSVANDKNYLARRDDFIRRMGTNPSIFEKSIYNRRVALAITIVENYAKNVSWRNLFVSGTGTYGALYPFESILLVFGIAYILKLDPFVRALILTWAFTAFLPGAFSTNQPNTLRTLVAAPIFAIISGLGAYRLVCMVHTKRMRLFIFGLRALLFISFLTSFPKFYHAYFIDNPTNNAVSFADGNKQAVAYAISQREAYDQIIISGYYWRPYIFMLYWGNIDATFYQTSGNRDAIGPYHFTAAPWDTSGTKLMNSETNLATVANGKHTLFLLSPMEYELHKNRLTKITSISGARASEVFIAATLNTNYGP